MALSLSKKSSKPAIITIIWKLAEIEVLSMTLAQRASLSLPKSLVEKGRSSTHAEVLPALIMQLECRLAY